jgi:type IV pilus assembly protein PilE
MARHQNQPRQLGFTLIELMITVGVIALLAAIAMPMYNEQVRSSRRADAQSRLSQVVQCMERFNTSNGTYVGGDARCATANNAFYTFAIVIPNRNSFSVTATAAGSQAVDRCGNLGLDQAGQKTHSAGTGCWN